MEVWYHLCHNWWDTISFSLGIKILPRPVFRAIEIYRAGRTYLLAYRRLNLMSISIGKLAWVMLPKWHVPCFFELHLVCVLGVLVCLLYFEFLLHSRVLLRLESFVLLFCLGILSCAPRSPHSAGKCSLCSHIL